MLRFKFAKLVRDKIVDHQIASGAKPSFRYLSDSEHKKELVKKIIEEVKEITHANPDEVAAEIADVQQALDDLKSKYGLTDKDIEQAQKNKNDKSGAFKKGCYIDYVDINDDDKWVQYYRENADRYPEIK